MSRTTNQSGHQQRLAIVYRPIGEMTADPTNARQHSQKQIRKLAKSIETFGFNVPVLVEPVAMVADATLDCSACGDIVLDSFLGSGTTMIATEGTGRRCCALELDPIYVDTAVRRWQSLTGESARHAASGRSFDDLAREAEAVNVA